MEMNNENWISVNDGTPTREGLYLTYDEYGTWNLYWFNGSSFDTKYDSYHQMHIPITHWMPLPEPPSN
jgi:hypothetical protein